MLDPAGEFPTQQDPSFLHDVMHLKARQGGWGIRLHSDRMPFLNCLLSALPRMIGKGSTQPPPLWASLARTMGDRSVFEEENEPEKRWLETYFASGSRMASEARGEIARVRAPYGFPHESRVQVFQQHLQRNPPMFTHIHQRLVGHRRTVQTRCQVDLPGPFYQSQLNLKHALCG